MTVEASIFTALTGFFGGRVYPDVAPVGTVTPYATYQQIGGEAVNFMEATVPSKKRGRFQINIWGSTRASVAALAIQVEDALRVVTALQTTVEGAPQATYEPDTGLRGSMQDFSFIF